MPDRAEYQPLVQDVDDDDVPEVLPLPVTVPTSRRGLRRSPRPGNIDLSKLDHAFKR
jgi:phosphatidylinositol 4-kinase type 2